MHMILYILGFATLVAGIVGIECNKVFPDRASRPYKVDEKLSKGERLIQIGSPLRRTYTFITSDPKTISRDKKATFFGWVAFVGWMILIITALANSR
jgi:hypothetical protein